MIETEPIPLDRRLFTSFYRDGNLQLESTNPLGSDILPFFDPIIATWIDEATSSIDKPNQPDLHNESERVLGFLRNLPWEEVAERYWERHTDEYTSRLARLVEGVPGNFVTEKTKSIVVIAARNETDLERALQAVRDSYGDNFEEEVCILVYHNYTDEPSAEVWHALTKASQHFSNLHVINEQVPQFYNVGTAKKVAADLAMLVQRGQREVPLVLVDADISGLSPESIQQAINVLAETGMIDPKLQSDLYTPISHDRFHIAGSVAVSTAYDFDKEAKRKFPVLSLVWDLRRELFTAELANRNTQSMISKNPIGPFTVISLKVLCAIGGLMPIPFGDMALGRALDQLVLNYHTGLQSVYPLDIHGGVVYMNPDRQISSLIAGMPEAFHWSGTSRYLAVSGKQRFDWHEIDAIQEIAELGDWSPEHILEALNDFWFNNYISQAFQPEQIVMFASQEIVRLLDQRGIKISFSVYVYPTRDAKRGTVIADGNTWIEGTGPKEAYRWMLWKIREVTLVTS